MKTSRITNQKGFTLVELLLAITLLVVSVGVTNDILMSLIRANNKTQVMNEIEQQSNFVFSKIEKELRNADRVTLPLTGEGGSTLTFISRNDVVVTYNLNTSTGIITRQEDSGTVYDLTANSSPGGVIISCPTQCFQVSGDSPKVVHLKMEFKQAQLSPNNSYTGKTILESTIVIRNTY